MATHVQTHPDHRNEETWGGPFFSIATPIIAAVLSLLLAIVVVLTAK
ncbi:MAG TPA: hypothetical protein VFV99_20065 [Kofleriaceae bacterium]|nr:hypothetical protein [Kofleriaceae bacterium]